MNSPTLSILVPVYNVEAYLEECLNSILAQQFDDYELLLIDDGSTDRSPQICDDYSRRDTRIRVWHQPNAGQASVRNAGLAAARGRFVCFVDSDDLMAPSALRVMMTDILDSGADMVLGRVERFSASGRTRPYTRLKERRNMTGEEALRLVLDGRELNISVCVGVFRRSLFDGIRFPDGYVCEDWFVTPSLFLRADRVVFNPTLWYRYRENDQSTMGRLYKKCNPQVIDVCCHAISVISGFDNRQLYLDTLWSNLRRVWKYVGIVYSHQRQKEEQDFLEKVRKLLTEYWPDLKAGGKMNRQEKLGVWSFCHCQLLCFLLFSLKRIF